MQPHPAKKNAALEASKYVKDGMTVGLGTGSTVYYLLEALGARVREGLQIKGVVSSIDTFKLAQSFDIPLIENLDEETRIHLNIDGADEVDGNFTMIKGGGGALLREKINAYFAKQNIIIVDTSKVVKQLGNFPLPIEVVPHGFDKIAATISASFNINTQLRRDKEGQLLVTDNHNHIIDAHFQRIEDPVKVYEQLIRIPGVVEVGLFLGLCDLLIIGSEGSVETKER